MEFHKEIDDCLAAMKDLPVKAMYLAGAIQAKTELPLKLIGKFLRNFYLDYNLNSKDMIELENKLFEGKIGEVHECLRDYDNEYTTQDLIKIIKKLKNSELYDQKFLIPLEEKCFICGSPKFFLETFIFSSCQHCFHKECLINEINFLFENHADLVKCPLCSEVVSGSDLEKLLPQSMISLHEKISEENNSKGLRKARCSNNICKEIVEIREGKRNCDYCGWSNWKKD